METSNEELKAICDSYCNLVKKLTRIDDETKENLINYLGANGFFTSPLTSEYFYSYEGGLAKYSIDLYSRLIQLNTALELEFNEESLLILALFNSLGKLNYYKKQAKNVKVYSPNGTNMDELGRYHWRSEISYGVTDARDRGVFGSFGLGTYMNLSRFVPLYEDEIVVLTNFNCGYEPKELKDGIELYKSYRLLVFLQSVSRMLLYLLPTPLRSGITLEDKKEDLSS